jgi:hypothetical protein
MGRIKRGFGMEMSVTGLNEIATHIEEIESELTGGKIIRDEFELGSRLLLADAKKEAPDDTGELKDSLEARVRGVGADTTAAVFSDLERSIYSEKGSRPHWPPIAALEGWAQRHGFPAKGGAFLVARAISQRGTPAFRFMEKALKKNQRSIVRRFMKAFRDLWKR